VILLDTSGLLSALDESQRHHHECAKLLDYLLMRHVGRRAQAALLD